MAKATTKEPEEQVEQTQDAPGVGVEVSDAQLSEATEAGAAISPGQIDILLDMTMPVSARLGQIEMDIRQILQLGRGSVLQLDKKAGEPVDLYLHGRRFAIGSLVVIGEQLGVRIQQILPSASAPEAASRPAGGKEAKATS